MCCINVTQRYGTVSLMMRAPATMLLFTFCSLVGVRLETGGRVAWVFRLAREGVYIYPPTEHRELKIEDPNKGRKTYYM